MYKLGKIELTFVFIGLHSVQKETTHSRFLPYITEKCWDTCTIFSKCLWI